MTTDELRQKGIDTFDEWTAMWNFKLHLAEKIMAPYFTLRYAQADTEPFDDIHRAPALANIAAASRPPSAKTSPPSVGRRRLVGV